MATKKAGSTKKTTRSKSQSAKAAKTTVKTTVKAVSTKKAKKPLFSFSDRRTVLAAALIGEFIGTFILTGAFLATQGNSLYLSFAIVGIVLMVGTLSGSYLNPALTVGGWVTRKLGHARAIGYIVAQVLGATAAFMLFSAYMSAAVNSAGAEAVAAQAPQVFKLQTLTEANQWYVFFAEILGAAIIAFAFAGGLRAKGDRVVKALAYGFGVLAAIITAGVAASTVRANTVFNPAVANAASAVDWGKIDWMTVAVYFVAPLIGAIVGFALRDVVETE